MAKTKRKVRPIWIIVLLLLIAALGFYAYQLSNPYLSLRKDGYTDDQIRLISSENLTNDFKKVGSSELMRYALDQNQENIKNYTYFLVKDADLPSGKSVPEVYELYSSIIQAGYTPAEFLELKGLLSFDDWGQLLSQNPSHPENLVRVVEYLKQGKDIETSIQYASMDPNVVAAIESGQYSEELVNPLLEKGYSIEDGVLISQFLDENQLKALASMKHIPELSGLVSEPNFQWKLLPRYLMAIKNAGKSSHEAVSYVNDNQDYIPMEQLDLSSFYHDEVEVSNPDSITVLINKQNHFPEGWEPSDLAYLPSDAYYVNNQPLRQEARDALVRMIDDCYDLGIGHIRGASNYRSYNTQTTLYNDYVNRDGQAAADTYSARPGYSEHQTGLVSDLNGNGDYFTNFENFAGYSWVMENAHTYGFIQRYPKDKEFITGYDFESWHFRYVGVEPATIMYENGWTLEEYKMLYE